MGIWDSFKDWLLNRVLDYKLCTASEITDAFALLITKMDDDGDNEITIREVVKAIKYFLKD